MLLDDAFRAILRDEVRAAIREEIGPLVEKLRSQRSDDDFLTLDEAARLARVSKPTLRRWRDSGKLRRCGEGRNVLVSRAELVAFLRAGGDHPEARSIEEQAAAMLAADEASRAKRRR